jgi:hypothetical protein
MNLTGSPPTLIANVCALMLASAVAIDHTLIIRHYIEYGRRDLGSENEFWIAFIPALAMLVIRNRTFSFCFLMLYVLLSISMFLDVQARYFLGTHRFVSQPLTSLVAFVFAAIGCLAIYAVIAFIRIVVRIFRGVRLPSGGRS